jgi:hypothetical protein
MTKRTDEEKVDPVDLLDVLGGKLRDPHKIINGNADPLDDKDPSVCYAIAAEICRVLDQRATALCIPDTFQKAIDVWEFEVNNAVGFMLENFELEMTYFCIIHLEGLYKRNIMTINQPNVVLLADLLAPFRNKE